MPALPLTLSRTHNELKWLFPGRRFVLKKTTDGQHAVWIDNNPQASYVGQSWEEVMKQAVVETWARRD